jgi:O-antigen/teichoic acid export membrane protein
VLLARVSGRALGIAKFVILARLLTPVDFGLIGIAMFVLACLEVFTETGAQAALVQKRDDIASYLDVAWTLQVARGAAGAAVMVALAPLVARVFDQPGAVPVVQAMAGLVVLRALMNPAAVYFTRNLEFSKVFLLDFADGAVGLAVAVAMALLVPNVWALVTAVLAAHGVKTLLSYVVHPYRPRFTTDPAKLAELIGFGKWVFGSSVLLFLTHRSADLVVGRLLGTAALGLHQMAYRLAILPTTEVTHVISQVAFPAYARMQTARDELRGWYLATLRVTATVSTLGGLLLLLLSREVVWVVLGPAWGPMLPAFQVLCVYGLVRAYAATMGPLFQAVGRPDLVTKMSAAQAVLLALGLYPLTVAAGLVGAALALLAAFALPALVATAKVATILETRLSDLLRQVVPAALASVPVLLVFALLGRFWDEVELTQLLARLVAFAALYVGTALVLLGRRGFLPA